MCGAVGSSLGGETTRTRTTDERRTVSTAKPRLLKNAAMRGSEYGRASEIDR